MTNYIDLHTHSTASDGIYSPTELLQRAKDSGLRVLALTDHDSTGGLDEAAHRSPASSLGYKTNGLYVASLQQGLGNVRSANRSLGYLAHTFPGNVDAVFIE